MATQPQQPGNEEADKYVVVNVENGTESDPFDSWEEAQTQRNYFAGMDGAQPSDFEIRPVNEPEGTDDPTRPEVDEFADGGQEQKSVESDTVEPEPDSNSRDDTPDVELVEEQQAAAHDRQQQHAQNLEQVPRDDLQDPLENVPSWMLTEINHGRETSIDLNKRGTQVIAAALDLVVEAECEIAAEDTDFEYSRYRATVTDADGNSYNAVGDCHIDEQGKDKWDLERMAETRAKKRCVKWATAGGLEAIVK